MTYAIVYDSRTGNTKLLAETIKENIPSDECIYFGDISPEAFAADYIFAGFWTDKGTCSEDMERFLARVNNKKIFIFGTAGFGGSDEYFKGIINKVSSCINRNCEITGSFMCQGKMPVSVRNRYEAMRGKPNLPFNVDDMIENFDRALSHPGENDLNNLILKVRQAI